MVRYVATEASVLSTAHGPLRRGSHLPQHRRGDLRASGPGHSPFLSAGSESASSPKSTRRGEKASMAERKSRKEKNIVLSSRKQTNKTDTQYRIESARDKLVNRGRAFIKLGSGELRGLLETHDTNGNGVYASQKMAFSLLPIFLFCPKLS